MGAHHVVNSNILLQAAVGLHDVSEKITHVVSTQNTFAEFRHAAAFIQKIQSRDCISVRKN